MKISKSHRRNIEPFDAVISDPMISMMLSRPYGNSSRKVCSYCCGSGWKIQLVQPCEKCNGTGK
jgi:hypothetical protein